MGFHQSESHRSRDHDEGESTPVVWIGDPEERRNIVLWTYYLNATEAGMNGFAEILASKEPNIENRLLLKVAAMCF